MVVGGTVAAVVGGSLRAVAGGAVAGAVRTVVGGAVVGADVVVVRRRVASGWARLVAAARWVLRVSDAVRASASVATTDPPASNAVTDRARLRALPRLFLGAVI
jgi:hypothetical protein